MAASEPRAPILTHDQTLSWTEPLNAYRRLRAADLGPQLLEGLGSHPEARRAYIALAPAVQLEVRGGTLTITEGAQQTTRHDILPALREWTAKHTTQESGHGVFTGGWIGFVGYEFLHHLEPTLPVRAATTPDLCLWLCRDVLVFDRNARTVRLLCHDLAEEHEATGRAEATLRALASPPAPAPASRPSASPASPAPSAPSGAWQTSLDQASFESAASRLVDLVKEGDLFQANLATRFRTPCDLDPADLFGRLAEANPSPFMALLDGGDWQIVSCSPEQLFAVEDGILRSRPIAGTRPRGQTAEADEANERDLLSDPKEQAEHTMLVDLVRNDVAKVSMAGSVRVPERMSIERYRHVMHLVSRVEGTVRPETGFVDWLAALFPGGTITGAPKHRACLRIAEAEPVARGPYTGSAGWIGWNGDAHWNILIRTLVLEAGHAAVHAGSGIVAESDPGREWLEAGHKAQALLEAATGGDRGAGNRTRVGEVTRHGSWAPPPIPPGPPVSARVLLVDNYDSFTHNLADYIAALGARVCVVRNDEDWMGALAAHAATHIVLSPGPGRPEDSVATLEIAHAVAREDLHLPVLGVCLGHQALALAAGAAVDVGHAVHGKTGTITHRDSRLTQDLPSPLQVGRYHSLVVRAGSLPPDWKETAWLADGTLMAMEHRVLPAFGLQYHPESISTDAGLEILRAFLVL